MASESTESGSRWRGGRGEGGGGKRRGLGQRNDVLTTCKAVTLRCGQRIIAVFSQSKCFRTETNNNLHLYSANLHMNILCCALQFCYIKFMLKVTKAWETSKNYNKKYCKIIITYTVEHVYIFSKKYCLFPPIQILISSLWCNVMASLKLTLTYKAWATCAFTEITSIKRVCHKICVIWIWTNWSKNLYSGV